MSRFSPTVLPTSGRSLAQALGMGVNTYLATRQQKRQQDLEDEMRQRSEATQNAQLGEQGIHLLKPGETAPVAQNGSTVPQMLAHALNPSAGLPAVDAPLPRITAGDGYYIDRDEQQQNAQRSAQAKYQALLSEALAKGRAEDIIDPNARADKHAVAQSTVVKNTRPPVVQQGHVVDPVTGEVTFFDPTNPPKNLRIHPQPVQQTFTPVTVQDSPDAPPVIKPMNTHTGEVGPTIGGAKQATRIESATNTAAKARLEAAVSEMNNAHKGMEEYENALRNGTANINGLQQFASRVANSFTHDDPVSMTIQSSALATLNRTNPELARYIRRALSFAEGESMISQRPSDFRTKMSAFLSAAASGASPEMIHDIEQRRTSILDPLNRTVTPPPTGSAPAGNVDLRQPSGQHSQAQQLWDEAVAKHGKARVLKEYGPRPNE